jgi:hypothetical protein
MMNYKLACQVLELEEKTDYEDNEIKKQYRMLALMYHPDKNPSSDAATKFQEIHTAYEFLMKHNDQDTYDSDEEKTTIPKDSYRWVLFSFLKNVLKTDAGNYLFYTILEKISGLCEKNALETLEKLDKKVLLKIHELLRKYKDALHFGQDFVEKVEELIKCKVAKDECIILNPILDDLFENNLYKLTVNGQLYIVPLWHNELVYDNSGCELCVKCNPMLPENIEIDRDNNIHVQLKYKIGDLWEREEVNVNVGRKTLVFYPKLLKMKKTQTIILKEQGISRINTFDIYDVSRRSDVYLYLTLGI